MALIFIQRLVNLLYRISLTLRAGLAGSRRVDACPREEVKRLGFTRPLASLTQFPRLQYRMAPLLSTAPVVLASSLMGVGITVYIII